VSQAAAAISCSTAFPSPDRARDGDRARRPGGPLAFNRERYHRRNAAEHCFNRLEQWRGVATRFEKRPDNYHTMLTIASLMLWLARSTGLLLTATAPS
jgi:hypothetical protein